MGVFSFRSGPSYRGTTPEEQLSAAMDMPMSLTSTLWEGAKGDATNSYGLGTILRSATVPEAAPETGDSAATEALSTINRAVDPGVLLRRAFGTAYDGAPTLDEDQYKSSPYFRNGIPWDPGMTEDRAAALAEAYDVKRVREHFAQKRPITAFFGSLAGQALDPINYIPIAGPAVRAANAARFGKIGGAALTSSFDAAANTALFGIGTAATRAKYGDDVSWQAMASDIAMSALIGGAFGTIGGVLGRRSEARALEAQRVANERLSTLRNVQDARIALNDAIDGLARGEDVALGGNAVEAISRLTSEVERLSAAYDEVRASPTGPSRDPLVEIMPDDIEGTIVARGAFKDVNEVEFSKRGWGLVKVIWGHGDKSKELPEFQVSKADIVDLPNVLREYEPASVSDDGLRREWRVERDGRVVVYADTMMGENGRHLVTAFIPRNPEEMVKPLSVRRSPASPGSTPQAGNLVGDTVGDRSIGTPEAGRDVTGSLSEVGNPVQDTANQPLPSSDRGQSLPASKNIARQAAVDNSPARPEPEPAGKSEAEARIAKPDTYKAMAEQYRVNPEDGSFLELSDIEQVRQEGRITPEDDLALGEAQETYDNGVAYGEALKAAVACLI